jgi:hypothetical protein
VTKFGSVAPNIFGFAVWNLLHVTCMAPRSLRWCLYFWKIVPRWSTASIGTGQFASLSHLYYIEVLLKEERGAKNFL